MNDYSKMSDFEINKAVAEIVCLNWFGGSFDIDADPLIKDAVLVSIADKYRLLDFVNSWKCCGKLLEFGKIGIEPLTRTDDIWNARAVNANCYAMAANKNPRRAICECFLMMKAAE
jgi:hypothetical protein